MKTILKSMTCIAIGAMMAEPAAAQQKDNYPELEGPGPVIIISKDKNGKQELIDVFNETQRPHFHDPRAPRFLLTDRQGKFALGIGGYLKTTMEYDFDGTVDDIDFIPALIPQPGSTQVRNQFQMDAGTSTIFLKLVGRTKHLGNFIVYTAGNFRGSGKTVELQHAYLSFLGFTMGYDTGLFMDLAACPPTIDFQGPDGMTFYRATQLRYEANLMKGLKVGVGVEMPSVDGTPAKDVRINKQRMPDIPAYVQYSWTKGSHVRVGGILRSMTYEDEVSNKAKSITGWGIQASATAGLGNFRAYGQFTYGKGIAQYLNDMSNLNVDIVPVADEAGRMQVLPMRGWFAGLQYNFSKRVFASTSYSQSRLFTKDCYAHFNETQYKKGQYLVANVFWNVTHNFQVGVEYLHGWREDFNDLSREANRINLSAQYNF